MLNITHPCLSTLKQRPLLSTHIICMTASTYHRMCYIISATISLEMPVPSQDHYGFHSFPVVD